jgi:hypothetical protein
MPVVMTWDASSPGPLVRAGGCGYANGDYVSVLINGQTTVTIDLTVTGPSTGVSTTQQPDVLITVLPNGNSNQALNKHVQGNQLTFTIGDNPVEIPGYLHQLDITVYTISAEDYRITHPTFLAAPCTFCVYYVIDPNATTTTSTSTTSTTTTTTPAPTTTTTTTGMGLAPAVRKKAKVK